MAIKIPTDKDIAAMDVVLKQTDKLTDRWQKLVEEQNTAIRGRMQLAKALKQEVDTTALLEEKLQAMEDHLAKEQRMITATTDQLREQKKILEDAHEKRLSQANLSEQEEERYQVQRNALIDLIAKSALYGDTIEARVHRFQQENKAAIEAIRHLKARLMLSQKLQGAAQAVAVKLGFAADYQKTWTYSLMQTVAAIKGAAGDGLLDNLKELGKSLINYGTLVSVANAALNAVWASTLKLAYAIDRSRADFMRATGAAQRYGGVIEEVRSQNIKYFVDAESAGRAQAALYNNMSDFAYLTSKAQVALGSFTAVLDELGVSSEETAKIFQIGTKMLRKSISGVEQDIRKMFGVAQKMGIAWSKMAADFVAASKDLAKHGKAMTDVFLKFAAQSKATGIEMTSLIGLAKKFEHFDQAAEFVGHFNSLIGTNALDAMEMFKIAGKDSSLVLLKIRKAVLETGQSWETMSAQMRVAVAEQIAGGDMDIAAKLLSTSAAEFSRAYRDLRASRLADKQLQKQAEEATTIFKKLSTALDSLAVAAAPLAKALAWVLEGIVAINQAAKGLPMLLLGVITLLGAAFIAYKRWTMFINVQKGIRSAVDGIGSLTKKISDLCTGAGDCAGAKGGLEQLSQTVQEAPSSFEELTTSLEEYQDGLEGILDVPSSFEKLTTSISAGAKGFLALGAAILMVGGGIFVAAYGFSLLANAMSQLDWKQILGFVSAMTIIMGAFIVMLYLLTTASVAADAPLLLLGAAFLMIGGGVFLAVAGFALLVYAMSELVKVLIAALPQFGELILVLGMLMLAGETAVVWGPMLAFGLTNVALGFGALAIALATIKTADISAVASILTSFAAMAVHSAGMISVASSVTRLISTTGGLYRFAEALSHVISALAAMPTGTVQVGIAMLKNTASSVETMVESALKVTPEVVDNTSALVTQAVRYVQVQAEMKVPNMDAFVQALKESAAAPGSTEAEKSGKKQDVVLVLNERELGRAVEIALANRHNLRLA
jgi:hypothetical protein